MVASINAKFVMDQSQYDTIRAYCRDNGMKIGYYIGFILAREADRIKQEEVK